MTDETDKFIVDVVLKHFDQILKEVLQKEPGNDNVLAFRTFDWIVFSAVDFFFRVGINDLSFIAERITKILSDKLCVVNNEREKEHMKAVITKATNLN